MWHLHYDARQFFLACKSWDDGESLPRSALGLLIHQLVDNCSIQLTLMCPEEERKILYARVPPPGEQLPINVTPFDIPDGIPSNLEIREVVREL